MLILQSLYRSVELQVLHITAKFGRLGHKCVGVVTRRLEACQQFDHNFHNNGYHGNILMRKLAKGLPDIFLEGITLNCYNKI